VFKRRKLLVYPQFQIAILIVNLLTSVSSFLMVYIENQIAFHTLREMGRKSNLDTNQPYFLFLELQANTFYKHLLVAFIVGTSLSFIATLLFSHKLVGPLVRLRKFFTEIKETQQFPKQSLQFRKGDYLQDLVPVINDGLEVLKKNKSN
jgi:hypothetical protein